MSARYGHLRTDDLHDELERVAQKRSQEHPIKAPVVWLMLASPMSINGLKPLQNNDLQRSSDDEKNGAPERIRTSDPQIRSLGDRIDLTHHFAWCSRRCSRFHIGVHVLPQFLVRDMGVESSGRSHVLMA